MSICFARERSKDKLQFIGEMHIAIASLREGGGAAGDGRRARDNGAKFVSL